MILQCQVCGQDMEAIKSTKKYCSKSCENKARIKRNNENRNKIRNENGMLEKQCILCNNKFFPLTAAANKRSYCYNCVPEGCQLSRGELLNILRKVRGGKCEKCGYDTYLGALDFHHINPNEKDLTIIDRDFKLIDCINESKKCRLFCSNCHKEYHAGLWTLEELEKGE